MSMLQIEMGDYVSALQSELEASEISQQINTGLRSAWSHSTFGEIYSKQGKLNKAGKSFQRAITSYKNAGVKRHLVDNIDVC